MIRAGLCSVTLRQLPFQEVASLAAGAGLNCIEWGGDVHVPPGDLRTAESVAGRSEDVGLRVASYGSYYRVGVTPAADFAAIAQTAATLGAPRIRVWGGGVATHEAQERDWRRVTEDAARIADIAAEHGQTIAFEYHHNTLVDSPAGVERILNSLDRHDVSTYWQHLSGVPPQTAVNDLEQIRPRVTAVHVYAMGHSARRVPLAEQANLWAALLAVLPHNNPVDALLEFVSGDDPRQVIADAATLLGLIASDCPDT